MRRVSVFLSEWWEHYRNLMIRIVFRINLYGLGLLLECGCFTTCSTMSHLRTLNTLFLCICFYKLTVKWTSFHHTYSLHGADSFLRSYPVFSYSRNSPHFMEPEGSLPLSQVTSTCTYPEPGRSSPFPQIVLQVTHLNIIFPSTPVSSKWSPSLRFPHQNTVYASPLLLYMLHAQHIPFFSIWSPEKYWVRNTEH